MLRWFLNVILAIVVILIAILVAGALIRSKPEVPQQPPTIIIPEVDAPPLQPLINHQVRIVGFGSAFPKYLVDVTPQVAGEVIDKHPQFFAGEFIKKGQVLFRIDPTDYELARDRTQSEIELLDAKLRGLAVTEGKLKELVKIEQDRLVLADRDLKRTEDLIPRGAATQTELDRAREAVLGRQLQVLLLEKQLEEIPPQRIELEAQRNVSAVQNRQAEKDLERAVYHSPFDGRVISCPLEIGERVQAGEKCGTIYAARVMGVPVPLPASDMAWIDKNRLSGADDATGVDALTGKPTGEEDMVLAEVVWQAGPSAEPIRWYGTVARVEAGLAAETRTATAIVKIFNPPPGGATDLLDINMFCRVTIFGKTIPKAFLIPRNAAQPVAGETITDLRTANVYLVKDLRPSEDPDDDMQIGRLARGRVTVARYTDGDALILDGNGLEAGDRVVVGYIAKPVLGMDVRVAPAQPPAERPAIPNEQD